MIDEKKFESLEKLFNELLETVGCTNMTCEEIETETEWLRSEFQRLKGGWIPVSEPPKEENKYYLITYKVPGLPDYYIKTNYFTSLSDSTKIWEIEEQRTVKVVAWMPLPEPYIPPEETQVCTNKECTYNADQAENINCPAWNGCGGYQPEGE